MPGQSFILRPIRINIHEYYISNSVSTWRNLYAQKYFGTNKVCLWTLKGMIFFIQGINEYYETQGVIKKM